MIFLKSLILSFLLLSFQSLFAQSIADRYIGATGVTYFADFYQTPVSSGIVEYSNTSELEYVRASDLSLFTFMYTARLNLVEPSDNFAISASLTPSLGLTFSDVGTGSFNIPLMVNAEFGAGATYHTTNSVGFTIGAGFEFTKLGLFGDDYNYGREPKLKDGWVQPALQTGIRYWSKKNKMREINIRLGLGSAQEYREYRGEEIREVRSLTARLSFKKFLNY